MHPLIWGQICHDMLLFICAGYADDPTQEEKESMQLCIFHLFKRLPCQECAINAASYVAAHPINVNSRKELIQYIVTFHNHQDEIAGKKHDWTPLEAMDAAYARHMTNFKHILRADQKRIEDHKIMQDLIKENNQLKMSLGLPLRNDHEEIQNYELDNYFNSFTMAGENNSIDIVSVVLVVFVVMIFFIIVMAIVA